MSSESSRDDLDPSRPADPGLDAGVDANIDRSVDRSVDPGIDPSADTRDVPFRPGVSRRAVQRGTYAKTEWWNAPAGNTTPSLSSRPAAPVAGTPVPNQPDLGVTDSRWAPLTGDMAATSVTQANGMANPAGGQAGNPWTSPSQPVQQPPFTPRNEETAVSTRQQALVGVGAAAVTPYGGGTGGMPPAGPPFAAPLDAPAPDERRSDRKGPGWGALIAAMVVAALIATTASIAVLRGPSLFGSGTAAPEDAAGTSIQSGSQVVAPVTQGTTAPDWEAVAAAVRPATVSIMVQGESEAASGSGVIIDGDGHVITNHHVVSSAVNGGAITVTTHDGRIFNATIVGTDQTTDLAVLQLENAPSDLVAARLGDSDALEVGQPVMAIGSPLGLSDTVTTGVISALDRPVTVRSSGQVDPADPTAGAQTELVITNAIQIDASINPGNSGGPLFDATGAVVGINSSIASNSSSASEAGSIGLGFAIPADLVKSVASQILQYGTVQHARLGVEIRTATVERQGGSQLGAEVATVMSGGAAELAGLQPGDVIIGIDGHAVTSGPALTGYVRRYTAGQQITLDVVRGGQDLQVQATLEAR